MDFETGSPPNKYTKAMGEFIRKAREEAGLSQEELAKKIYRRRASVSDMEKGKVEINAWVIVYLSEALEKPISYFYPKISKYEPEKDELTELEKELVMNFRWLESDRLKKLGINLIKLLYSYKPVEDIFESIKNTVDPDTTLGEFFKKYYD